MNRKMFIAAEFFIISLSHSTQPLASRNQDSAKTCNGNCQGNE